MSRLSFLLHCFPTLTAILKKGNALLRINFSFKWSITWMPLNVCKKCAYLCWISALSWTASANLGEAGLAFVEGTRTPPCPVARRSNDRCCNCLPGPASLTIYWLASCSVGCQVLRACGHYADLPIVRLLRHATAQTLQHAMFQGSLFAMQRGRWCPSSLRRRLRPRHLEHRAKTGLTLCGSRKCFREFLIVSCEFFAWALPRRRHLLTEKALAVDLLKSHKSFQVRSGKQ